MKTLTITLILSLTLSLVSCGGGGGKGSSPSNNTGDTTGQKPDGNTPGEGNNKEEDVPAPPKPDDAIQYAPSELSKNVVLYFLSPLIRDYWFLSYNTFKIGGDRKETVYTYTYDKLNNEEAMFCPRTDSGGSFTLKLNFKTNVYTMLPSERTGSFEQRVWSD